MISFPSPPFATNNYIIFFKSNLFYCKIHDFIAYNLPPPTNNYIKFFNLNLFYCKLNNFIPSPTCSHATTGNPTGISLTIIKRRPCHFLTQTPLKLSLFLHFYYIFPIFFIYCIYTTFSPFFPYTAFTLHFPIFFLYCIYTTFPRIFPILFTLLYFSPYLPYITFLLSFSLRPYIHSSP